MSSPSRPPRPSLYCLQKNRTPSRWYSRRYVFIAAGTMYFCSVSRISGPKCLCPGASGKPGFGFSPLKVECKVTFPSANYSRASLTGSASSSASASDSVSLLSWLWLMDFFDAKASQYAVEIWRLKSAQLHSNPPGSDSVAELSP